MTVTKAPMPSAHAVAPPAPRRGQRRVLVLLAVVVAAWTSAGVPVRATYGAQLTADEPQYVLSAISLAEDFDLDISDELEAERWKAFHSPAELPPQTTPLDGGRHVSPHDPLLPVLLAVPVALGGWVGAKLALAVLAGVLAALLAWTAHRRFGVRFGVSAAVVGAFALSPPLSVYATQVYPELPAALAVTVAIALLTSPVRDGRVAAGLVAAVTALPWLSVKYVPVAAVLAGAAAWRLRRDGRDDLVRASVIALLVSGLVWVVAHRVLYGGWTPYAAGDHFVGGEATVMGFDPNLPGRARRLVGLLVDREFGLVPWQPAFVLAVPAVAALAARSRHGVTAVVVLAAGWITATFAALTMHGWWWPGRQVVVVLPVLILAIAAWADRGRRVALTVALGAAGALSFAWLVVEGIARDRTWVVDFMSTSNPLYRAWRPLLPDGRSTSATALVLTALWALVVAAVGGYSLVSVRRAGWERRCT